ncbi:MAG: cold-shock protein [Lactobacillaceae bacterium]|jgi:CspA family cold shock protein|nr:cold-shock protein [Lactobacillaceae bacterium]
MNKGTVKWFNNKKGYGFIIPEERSSDKDVFVHISAIQKAGLDRLDEGQLVSYDIHNDRGREVAGNISVLS